MRPATNSPQSQERKTQATSSKLSTSAKIREVRKLWRTALKLANSTKGVPVSHT